MGTNRAYQQGLEVGITSMHEGGRWARGLKSHRRRREDSILLTVENFQVNIGCCTTVQWFAKHINRDSIFSGFLIRFIPVCAQQGEPAVELDIDCEDEKSDFRRLIPSVPGPELEARLKSFYGRLQSSFPEQSFIHCSPAASRLLSARAKQIAGAGEDEIGGNTF